MRLYRFIDTDKKIDATVVTDGSCDQKRVFITEMRGIVPAGGLAVNEDEQAGSDALLALGFNWHVGHAVMHEELVAFAENNGLTLEINPQGLNELVAVNAEWNGDDECVLKITTTLPTVKDINIHFPNSVNLNESVGRYGVIRGDRKDLAASLNKKESTLTFSLEDLGLNAKEDLNIVVTAESGIQKFEVVAEMA